MQGIGVFHLVTHSLGAFFGLHLRLAVGSRVARLTLIDPVVVSVLRVPQEEDALRETQTLDDRFMCASPDHGAAARLSAEHWSVRRRVDALSEKGRTLVCTARTAATCSSPDRQEANRMTLAELDLDRGADLGARRRANAGRSAVGEPAARGAFDAARSSSPGLHT